MNKTLKNTLIITAIVVVLVVSVNPKLRAGALAVIFAKKWVGIGEKGGENVAFTNEVFQQMIKNIGWHSGEAWCMYFAKAVHYDTFKDDRAEINKLFSGSTQLSWQNVKNGKSKIYKIITSGKPQMGDIVIWQSQKNKSQGHAGIVTGVEGDYFTTIEGNTDAGGGSEGEKVWTKKRPLKYGEKMPNSSLMLLGFIRHI